MKHGRIADPLAADRFAALADDVVFAVQEEEEMAREVAEVDALFESVERELADDERTEQFRVLRDCTDQVRARRARRRADRAAVRSLPVRLSAGPLGGEAA